MKIVFNKAASDAAKKATQPNTTCPMCAQSDRVVQVTQETFTKKNQRPSLEERMHSLKAKLKSMELTPTAMAQEISACKKTITSFLNQIQEMEFAEAFPIRKELGGS